MNPDPIGDTDGAAGQGEGPVPPPPSPPPAAPTPSSPPSPTPAPAPAPSAGDDWTSDPQRVIATQLALADAMKPIEAAATDLYSPDRKAAQDAIADKYDKAVAPDGDLRKKVDVASAKFDRAAADMVDRLDDWVKKFGDGSLHDMLAQRKATGAALDAMQGDNERARNVALDTAKNWAARFTDWSAPDAAIAKIVSGYVDQIDKLNADINNDVAADAAMLSFWLEITPDHLQVSDKPLSADAAAALGKVKDALGAAGYDDLAAELDPATARGAGAVYVIPAGGLTDKRKAVLTGWKDAAEDGAAAAAAFKLDPDDAATLKQRWDKLKGDAWIKNAKAVLTPTAS